MRTSIGVAGAFGIMALLACACGDAGNGGAKGGEPLPPRGDDGDSVFVEEEDETLAESDELVPANNPAELDSDGDGIADDVDCAPADPAIRGTRLLEDALSADTAKFSPAPGFVATNWTYAEDAYRQIRLGNASDATFFMGDSAIGDVDIEVSAASTDVTTITPKLRQMFILVGATMTDGKLGAYGCGVEVVDGMSPTQRTSIVRLSGSPDAVGTTPIQRVPRNILKEGEGFSIRAQVASGTLKCTVSQGADVVTTAEATDLTNLTGSIGFFTRQTKAAFKNVKACKMQAASPQPK
jgi:hypothetical protein